MEGGGTNLGVLDSNYTLGTIFTVKAEPMIGISSLSATSQRLSRCPARVVTALTSPLAPAAPSLTVTP